MPVGLPAVLITGGARGIGRALAQRLLQAGISVVVHYRTARKEAEELCRTYAHSQMVWGDLSSLEGIEAFREALSSLEIHSLVNNVGNYLVKPVMETEPKDWEALYFSNFLASVELVRALKGSICAHQGSIVNMGVAGLGKAACRSVAYTCLKSALWSYTLTLSKELASYGVNVNMVSPGYMENSMEMPAHLPMGRAGTLDEAAEAVHFCLNNKYVTGQNIEVAGGI